MTGRAAWRSAGAGQEAGPSRPELGSPGDQAPCSRSPPSPGPWSGWWPQPPASLSRPRSEATPAPSGALPAGVPGPRTAQGAALVPRPPGPQGPPVSWVCSGSPPPNEGTRRPGQGHSLVQTTWRAGGERSGGRRGGWGAGAGGSPGLPCGREEMLRPGCLGPEPPPPANVDAGVGRGGGGAGRSLPRAPGRRLSQAELFPKQVGQPWAPRVDGTRRRPQERPAARRDHSGISSQKETQGCEKGAVSGILVS